MIPSSLLIGGASLDTASVLQIMQDIATREIRPHFGKLRPTDIQKKDDGSLVTVIDPAVEALLSDRLRRLLPDALILGEESTADNPARLDLLSSSEKPIWVIDPLDGTSNFAAGRPEFAMIVALVQHNKTLAGWIYDVPGDRAALAVAGKGTFLAGQRVLFAQKNMPVSWGNMRGGWTINAIHPDNRGPVKAAAPQFRSITNAHCAAFEYLSILENRKDFHLFNRLKPWDHCAGALILQEAEGHALRLVDGTTYAPDVFDGGLLVGKNYEQIQNLRQFFLNPLNAKIG